MDPELRVPVRRLDARLLLSDGSRREVTLFVAHGEAIEDLFEADAPFMPVSDEGKIRIYSRAEIACVTMPGSEPDDGLPRQRRKVAVTLRSHEVVEGELLFIAPARTADLVNTTARSFALHAEGRIHHIAKAHVAFIDEV
jgi:hypothetical protein